MVNTDVLVIGGGGAGLRAAIAAAQSGARVLMVSQSRVGYGNNTAIAFGNMCAIVTPEDSPQAYLKDTILAGRYINDPRLVALLADKSANQVSDLEHLGVSFVRKEGELEIGLVPGHSYPRRVSAVKKGLGFSLPLRATAEAIGVSFLEGIFITKLVNEGGIRGAIGIDIDGVTFVIEAKAVILAAGGLGQVYLNTTNAASTTGDGYALAYETGAVLQDMEMVQFYPTATVEGTTKQIVLYEFIVHQAGGIIRNIDGEDVLEKYGLNNPGIMTRDRLARAMMTELVEGRDTGGALAMDLSNIKRDVVGKVQSLLPKRAQTSQANSIPVAPAAHFQMGGIRIDDACKTSIDGLFGAGEVCGGVHGANRLGGNSLTDIFVFGERAGMKAASWALEQPQTSISEPLIKAECKRLLSIANNTGKNRLQEIRHRLKSTMWLKSGIIRSNQSLSEALADIEQLRHHLVSAQITEVGGLIKAVKIRNMINVSEMIIRSALLRTESRGAHFRTDYPEKNDERWLGNIYIRKGKQNMLLKYSSLTAPPT
jgi:succinate dehydrogenase/fumarate reductase flavoprotein subunit